MDLYYRLNVFPLVVPALRRRVEDIPLLVTHFVRQFCERVSKHILKASLDAINALMRYSWPGNIRELENYIERAVIITKGAMLEIPALPTHQRPRREPITLQEAERDHILKALEESNWVVGGMSGAAARLGLARTTLIYRMRKCGISREKRYCRA
jgi:formate hydrogenlyase transcriptional activator